MSERNEEFEGLIERGRTLTTKDMPIGGNIGGDVFVLWGVVAYLADRISELEAQK